MTTLNDHTIAFTNGLRVSFQRYLLPASGHVATLPRSLGALFPAWGNSGELLLAAAPDEAFWIGLDATSAERSFEIIIGGETDADGAGYISGTTPHTRQLIGLPSVAGFSCLAWKTGTRSLALYTSEAPIEAVVVRLALAAAFTSETGQPAPAPLNPDDAYRGDLLP